MAQQLAITPFKGITNRTKVTTASWSALLHSFYVEKYKTNLNTSYAIKALLYDCNCAMK